jgi:hypothetical protein
MGGLAATVLLLQVLSYSVAHRSASGPCIICGTYWIVRRDGETTKPGDAGSVLPHGIGRITGARLAAGLDRDDRRAIGLDLMRVQFGWPIGRPLVRSRNARVHQEDAENARG